jgi:hypothetical protein
MHGLWAHGGKGDATDEDVPCDCSRLVEEEVSMTIGVDEI